MKDDIKQLRDFSDDELSKQFAATKQFEELSPEGAALIEALAAKGAGLGWAGPGPARLANWH
jgi:hypothetical protein